ncbi:MAG: Trans-aconitate 2-methyltransferase [Chlamydiae bacterium]|nr:Trans-aconitate 2-methyltransferase [Chlamydiota bacterium]
MSFSSNCSPCVNTNSFRVSSRERPAEAQLLIDESFEVRVLPLHQGMFEGRSIHYLYWGQDKDYTFIDSQGSVAGIKASKIAEEFASKKKFAVLDLGCGVGSFLQGLKERFPNVKVMGVTAADFRPTRYNSEGLKIPDEEYVVANLENLNQIQALKGEKFDFIVSSVTFRHLSDPLGVLCQAYDLLNENGVLLVDDFRLNGISEDEYLEIFKEAGCKNLEIQTFGASAVEIKQTKIRKVGFDRLCLPVSYDLSKSTKASDLEQANIFYTRDVKKN